MEKLKFKINMYSEFKLQKSALTLPGGNVSYLVITRLDED
jgi:hypothetical protein